MGYAPILKTMSGQCKHCGHDGCVCDDDERKLMNTTIGIDPGTNGGIAWIMDGKPCVEKMPDTLQDLWELLRDIASEGKCHAYLEQVHSSPQMGVKSAFTFGNGFGHLEMALTAAGIPFTRVRPQVWQKELGCMTKGNKNITKQKAQELFPSMKVNHYIADALLIAEYGRRIRST